MKPKNLTNHPEGGRFAEIFKSNCKVTTSDGKERTALTHIYFSLNPGEVSKFHKVASDEVWNLYEGTGLLLYIWDGRSDQMEIVELSKHEREYCHIVPAGMWQAAEPIHDTILAGCSVAPGFEFEDFELIDPAGEEASLLLKYFSDIKKFL
ncbi:MAG: cupin domain-containing protein [Ignavibacteriae bacterium]|nr:cupin domain-containing protein [Ignavibacteriota bacterium]NOG99080.1 cupin domain-containing protein [Ignavibacteriota bacterium]